MIRLQIPETQAGTRTKAGDDLVRQAVLVVLQMLGLLVANDFVLVLDLSTLLHEIGFLQLRHAVRNLRKGRQVAFDEVRDRGGVATGQHWRKAGGGEVGVPGVEPFDDGIMAWVLTREVRSRRLVRGLLRVERVDGVHVMVGVEHHEGVGSMTGRLLGVQCYQM